MILVRVTKIACSKKQKYFTNPDLKWIRLLIGLLLSIFESLLSHYIYSSWILTVLWHRRLARMFSWHFLICIECPTVGCFLIADVWCYYIVTMLRWLKIKLFSDGTCSCFKPGINSSMLLQKEIALSKQKKYVRSLNLFLNWVIKTLSFCLEKQFNFIRWQCHISNQIV